MWSPHRRLQASAFQLQPTRRLSGALFLAGWHLGRHARLPIDRGCCLNIIGTTAEPTETRMLAASGTELAVGDTLGNLDATVFLLAVLDEPAGQIQFFPTFQVSTDASHKTMSCARRWRRCRRTT
jgi:hypothetical protein